MRAAWAKHKEVIRYLIFGAATTLVNWLTYGILMSGTIVRMEFGNAIAWFVSVLFAFVTNKVWVFESRTWRVQILCKELGLFFGARMVSGLFEMVSVPALYYLGMDRSVFGVEGFGAKILVSVIVVALNYVFSKWLIFRKK